MLRPLFSLLLGVLTCWTLRAAAPPVDFSRDILPLLADNCFHCHGPDEKGRKAKLRLDTLAGAQSPREGGKPAVVVLGRSRESELVKRILSADPDEVMPPPDSHRTLSDEQKKLLQRWVDEGAKWGRHWAFEPIKAVSPPKPKTKWGANEIDRFILAKLEENALQPAAETSPGRLLRRLSLDLTGLPPTPSEVDEFERAWSRATSLNQRQSLLGGVVDRLLSSPRYGERMAAEWLDVARYADTHGYQMDRPRPVWPYRDWVIKAFNENLPFDQFVTWQIAGDLLPNATQEQRLATAFNRLHMQNEEGGIVEEEFRVAYVVDRVNTFGTAFLGLTLECSRCHDHKYDPVSQRDFYSLFAFFQNIDEAGQTTYFTDATPVPAMPLTTPEQDARLARLNQAVADAERNARLVMPQLEPAFQEWLKSRSGAPGAAGLAGVWSFDELKDNKAANSVNKDQTANAVESPRLVAGRSGQAVELTGENGFTFPGAGQFTRTDPFSFAITLRPADHATRATVFHKSRAPADAGSRGYELVLEQGRAAFGLHHMWPGNSLKVRTRAALSTNDWSQLIITYDGSSRAAGVRIYVNGEPAELETVRDGLTRDITYERDGQPDLALGFRFRDTGFKGGLVDDFRVFNRELTTLEIAEVAGGGDFAAAWSAPAEQLNPGQRAGLLAYYVSQVSPLARRYAEAMGLARREQSSFVNSLPELMVMQEMPRPKPAFVLKRGAYDAPGEAVAMATPAALPAWPAGAPTNRLGLARWLTAPENPLFARVTVNRAWQQMFGRGFVETSDNFGTQGSFPTHPDLLDWLARDFMAGGWNYRALLKKIALSATYRQDSRASDAARQRDPDNRLLSHAPPRRLSAEMLRDQALAASGLLVEKLGGPSVKPYQPDGFWDDAMGRPRYDQGHGDDLHRRSLYTYWKRTAPHPAMITFDAANRETCLVKRQSTATPLQSLALLNDTQVIEAARFLAQRMLREGGPTLDRQVGWLFRLVTARQPSTQEVAVLRRLFEEQREVLAKDPLAVNQLLAVGEAVPDPSLPFSDLAAGTVLAKAILNHDEAVMRR